MKFEVSLGINKGQDPRANTARGTPRIIEIEKHDGVWRIVLDGKRIDADVSEVEPGVFSVLLNGESHEVRVTPQADGTLTLQTGHHEFGAEVFDPRAWRGRRHAGVEAEGRQQITAPMPGKVVRVLVQTGDKVEAGQGLIVVEAMKMQNEIRSPKSGTVERLAAKEGQPVDAGEVLAIVA
jgi:biotin carboxyl carrier protein